MPIVTATTPLKINTTTVGEGYHNVFYEYVLKGLKSTLHNEFPGTQVYIAPDIIDGSHPFSIRLWGISAEIESESTQQWQKRYEVEFDLYCIEKNANENFYKQFYADIEHIHQIIFNNKTLAVTVDSKTFTWIDGNIGEIEINDFKEEEDQIDGLHKASFNFSCLVEREG